METKKMYYFIHKLIGFLFKEKRADDDVVESLIVCLPVLFCNENCFICEKRSTEFNRLGLL